MNEIINMIKQVIDLYHPLALRLFLIGTHYRSTISYSKAQLEASSDRLYYIFQTLLDCENSLVQYGKDLTTASIPKDIADCINKFQVEFEKSLADDVHTPVALAMFSEPLKLINDLLHTRKVMINLQTSDDPCLEKGVNFSIN
ncbi:hypothetical protein HPP92_020073 [Vanilla planifolia]|uniref:Uncharacterized protein n=1 Tax=Vanilla planifolia TaxID=51239 RepID=A0A835UI51_VANPL|nr:hypothetical protein HPP92_020073 [Vanilla planifolia]